MESAEKEIEKRPAQSTIAFPYMDLEAAISIARALHESGAVPLSRDQLAGVMNSSPGGGTFLTKIATARTFGLITHFQGKYELTQLGHEILSSDENRQRAARAEAFMAVPLYRKTYEEFRGKELPPKEGLQNAFVSFGVAPKQAYNARLAFEKSANQAGFFAAGTQKLVPPILGALPPGSAAPPVGTTAPTSPSGPSGRPGYRYPWYPMALSTGPRPSAESTGPSVLTDEIDPLILGLLQRLPKAGEKWSVEKRARWLQTLAANFDIVYESDDGGAVIVQCKTDN
ncbi:hypothetical protein ACQR0Z_25680 [Bradyrhizobium sp. HKCCYLS3077]|uniref:hypothetical protein n=1 Tax=Bradyrhizobium sp. HKCCYLS3077 TaxID=3420761 RepID=UPI003EBD5DE7